MSFDALFSGIKKRNFYRKQLPKRPTSKFSERGVDVRSDVKTNVGAVASRDGRCETATKKLSHFPHIVILRFYMPKLNLVRVPDSFITTKENTRKH